MDYFIPKQIQGRGPDGRAFMFFRGIHAVPDALANSTQANDLGIVPVEEMSDTDWRLLGLDKAKWMAANRPAPEVIDAVEEPEPVAATVASTAPKPASPAPVTTSSGATGATGATGTSAAS